MAVLYASCMPPHDGQGSWRRQLRTGIPGNDLGQARFHKSQRFSSAFTHVLGVSGAPPIGAASAVPPTAVGACGTAEDVVWDWYAGSS